MVVGDVVELDVSDTRNVMYFARRGWPTHCMMVITRVYDDMCHFRTKDGEYSGGCYQHRFRMVTGPW